MSQTRHLVSLLLVVLVFAFSPAASAMAAQKIYTLGVLPAVPPVPTHAQWAPFVERLSSETGLKFELKLYETMSDFERSVVSPEGPDFIFSHALELVVAHEEQGYLPLVRGSVPIRAVIFVPRDSPVKSVEDLEGKKIAFVGDKNL